MSATRSGLAPRDRAATLDLATKLSRIPPRTPKRGPAPLWLMHDLGELLECDFILATRPAEDPEAGSGWSLGQFVSNQSDRAASYDAVVRGSRKAFNYDPLRPDAAQRNQVRLFHEIHTHGPATTCAVEDVWPDIGMGGWDQVRVLVCDGGTLLAWVGGMRPARFTAREQRILTMLLPSLRRRLALQRLLLDVDAASREIEATMMTLAVPALIAKRDGSVLHANDAASSLAEKAPIAMRRRVRLAVNGDDGATIVASIDAASLPECFLVVLRPGESELEARISLAAARWGVTRREREVLAELVLGDANKEIALKLAVHEGSVERHITSILRKARCDGRSRLVAQFWTSL